ncbi:MAG: class I SAM-dependent methyltransferase, partial [Halioglobus sp.]|nr:class I SAM-dependent methyltransferase [Halioglobus sp.]
MNNYQQDDQNLPVARGLAAGNFRPVAVGGFGDGYNSYPHSMAWFKGHLYVGTTRAVLAHRGRWRKMAGGVTWNSDIWPVKTPEGPFDIDLRAEIWRYSPTDAQWKRVYHAPMVIGAEGFEVPRSIAFRAMLVFQGSSDPEPALYVPTMGSHQNPEALLLRSIDGEEFVEVSEPGLRFPEEYKPRGVRALIQFRDLMFTAPAVGATAREPNKAGFMVIAVNADPSNDRWQLACEPGFGTPNNATVFDMEVFDNHLYAGTMNPNEGFQIWKTTAEGAPPYHWELVMDKGGYRGQLNQIAMTLTAFAGHLYVGTAIQGGGRDPELNVGPVPCEIIRIHPDNSWDLVVGDPRVTPEGLKVPLSGLAAGFGKFAAGYLWSMRVHDGWLYAGTFDWMVSLPFIHKDNWTDVMRRTAEHLDLDDLVRDYGGCDIWRTRDGVRWLSVTHNGFDNQFNYGARTMVSTPHGLFVGMANPFGPEVAVKRKAGWRYEHNARGGIEIWLGSIGDDKKQDCLGPKRLVSDPEIDFERGVDIAALSTIETFFGDTGCQHLGYWGGSRQSARESSENLLAEVTAFLPEAPGAIVELGCGSGATTRYLKSRHPDASVQGYTADGEKFLACSQIESDITFKKADLAKLKQPTESADAVVWIAGQDQLCPREKLLREAYRLLRPGGVLACFDKISLDAVHEKTLTSKNRPRAI